MALSDLFGKLKPGAKPSGPPEPTVESLSKTMCDRKAVHWAAESAKLAGPAMNAAEKHAMDAAGEWLKNPSELTKLQAQEAALKAGHGGPGAWAAQAAAWATHVPAPKTVALKVGGKLAEAAMPKLPGGAAPALKLPGGGSLAGIAVSGAVGLAAAMKAGIKLPAPGGGGPVSLDMAKNLPKPSAEDLAKVKKAQLPFVELGKKIAADASIKC